MTPAAEMLAEAPVEKKAKAKAVDRPGWIPAHITENWDPNPYAYQTEEELMPQGGPHDHIIVHIRDVIRPDLEARDLMTLSDVFIIFRDQHGVQRRNSKAADIMVVPHEDPPPKAWYLDQRLAPLITMEIPSAPDEKVAEKKDIFIAHGTQRHVVVDQLDKNGEVAKTVKVRVWGPDGKRQKPDANGLLDLPEIGLKIPAKALRKDFTLHDGATGEPRKTSAALLDEKDEALAQKDAEVAEKDEALAKKGAEVAEKDEALAKKDAEMARLQAELEKLRQAQKPS